MEGTSPKWEKCLILFLLWFTVTFVSIFWGSCHLLMRLFIVKCCVETLNAVPVALSYDYSFGCFCSLVYRVKPFFPVLICDVFTSIVAAIWTCVMAACCIHSSILLRWLVWKSNLTMLMSYFQCPNQSVVGQFTILWQPFSVHTYEAVINVCWHSVKTNPIPQHDATSTVMFTDISNNKVINLKFG